MCLDSVGSSVLLICITNQKAIVGYISWCYNWTYHIWNIAFNKKGYKLDLLNPVNQIKLLSRFFFQNDKTIYNLSLYHIIIYAFGLLKRHDVKL